MDCVVVIVGLNIFCFCFDGCFQDSVGFIGVWFVDDFVYVIEYK